MRVIEAPNDIILNDNEITCFLAGGITDCEKGKNGKTFIY